MTERVRNGWWRCDCDRTCKCGGNPKKLNAPNVTQCARCKAQRP